MRTWRQFPTQVVPWLLVLGGSFFLIAGATTAAHRQIIRRWPTTSGVVIVSRAERASVTRGRTATMPWTPGIHVRYTVRDTSYTRTTYRLDPLLKRAASFAGPDEAPPPEIVAILTRYPVGTPLTVRYHPRKPHRAYVNLPDPGWRDLALGLTLLLARLAWLALLAKRP